MLAGLRFAAAILSVLVLVLSGLMWFLYRDFTGKVDRVNAIGRTVDDVDGRDQNILLVGSDDRTNASPQELAELSTTNASTNSTDTMILVHVPADGRQATAVSFPRDSYVEIPGFGRKKLNAAYINGALDGGNGKPDADRGRQLLVQTISELSGLKVDHYVEVDLLGFYRITKAIGGVEVCLREAQRERDSGIDLPAGRSVIEGKQALAFVRQRKGLPGGDLDRIARQQAFLGATFRKMTSVGVLGNPIKLKRLLDAVGSSLRMDAELDPLQLARQVRGLAAGNVEFKTIPTAGSASRDGQSVVLLDEEKLPGFFRSICEPAAAEGAGQAGGARPGDGGRLQRHRPVRARRHHRGPAAERRVRRRRHRQRRPAGLQPDGDPVRPVAGGTGADAGGGRAGRGAGRAVRHRGVRPAGGRRRLRRCRVRRLRRGGPGSCARREGPGPGPHRRRHRLHQLTPAPLRRS